MHTSVVGETFVKRLEGAIERAARLAEALSEQVREQNVDALPFTSARG